MCVAENVQERIVQSTTYEQIPENEMLLAQENELLSLKPVQGIIETIHYRVFQDNITVT